MDERIYGKLEKYEVYIYEAPQYALSCKNSAKANTFRKRI